MENAIVIAKILAPLLLVFGLSMFLNANWYKKIITELPKNLLLNFFMATFKFMFGVLILTFYSSWTFSWALIITIMGRLSVVMTGIYLIYPKFLNNIMKVYTKKSVPVIVGIIIFILGVIFMYYGFLAA
ncbi:hypothetical protein K9M48_00415 [Candidatus Gracilibacteria bacterium]|nr:hypothetical protein [Candidatus Gracilibacteria bacterium]